MVASDLTASGTGTAATYATGKFGQGLTATATSAPGLAVGGNFGVTSAWTVEAWVQTTSTGTNVFFGSNETNAGWFGINAGKATLAPPATASISSTASINDGLWHHVAASSDGTNGTKLFVDGVLEATASTPYYPWHAGGASVTGIGQQFGTTSYAWVGVVDEIRVSSIQRYSATFTAPTAAFTADASTKALWHLDGDGTDASGNGYDLSPADGVIYGAGRFAKALFPRAKAFTTTQNFGAASPSTIELWVKQNGGQGTRVAIGNNGLSSNTWVGSQGTTAHSELYGTNISGTSNITDGNWHHLAFTYDGATHKIWVDGVLEASATTTSTTALWSGGALGIGQYGTNNTSFNWWGGLDEVRFSSVVRYTSTFTPPAAAFTWDSSTLALFHLNGDGTADNTPPATTGSVGVGAALTADATQPGATTGKVFADAAPTASASFTLTPGYTQLRMNITAIKSPGTNIVQLSELAFYDAGGARLVATSITSSNTGYSSNEGPTNLGDNSTATKLCVVGTETDLVTLTFASLVLPASYAWATANDAEQRDPASWTIQASNDGTTWTTLHTVTSYVATSSRSTWITPVWTLVLTVASTGHVDAAAALSATASSDAAGTGHVDATAGLSAAVTTERPTAGHVDAGITLRDSFVQLETTGHMDARAALRASAVVLKFSSPAGISLPKTKYLPFKVGSPTGLTAHPSSPSTALNTPPGVVGTNARFKFLPFTVGSSTGMVAHPSSPSTALTTPPGAILPKTKYLPPKTGSTAYFPVKVSKGSLAANARIQVTNLTEYTNTGHVDVGTGFTSTSSASEVAGHIDASAQLAAQATAVAVVTATVGLTADAESFAGGQTTGRVSADAHIGQLITRQTIAFMGVDASISAEHKLSGLYSTDFENTSVFYDDGWDQYPADPAHPFANSGQATVWGYYYQPGTTHSGDYVGALYSTAGQDASGGTASMVDYSWPTAAAPRWPRVSKKFFNLAPGAQYELSIYVRAEDVTMPRRAIIGVKGLGYMTVVAGARWSQMVYRFTATDTFHEIYLQGEAYDAFGATQASSNNNYCVLWDDLVFDIVPGQVIERVGAPDAQLISSSSSREHFTTTPADLGVEQTVPAPDGIVAGNLLLAYLWSASATDPQPTAPAGWRQSYRREDNFYGHWGMLAVYTKIATSAEPASYTFHWPRMSRNTGAGSEGMPWSEEAHVAGFVQQWQGATLLGEIESQWNYDHGDASFGLGVRSLWPTPNFSAPTLSSDRPAGPVAVGFFGYGVSDPLKTPYWGVYYEYPYQDTLPALDGSLLQPQITNIAIVGGDSAQNPDGYSATFAVPDVGLSFIAGLENAPLVRFGTYTGVPELVSTSSDSQQDNSSLIHTVPAPSDIVAGNLLVAYLYDSSAANLTSVSAPGWDLVYEGGTRWGSLAVLTRVATASEPVSYDFTWPPYGSSTYATSTAIIQQWSGSEGFAVTQANSEQGEWTGSGQDFLNTSSFTSHAVTSPYEGAVVTGWFTRSGSTITPGPGQTDVVSSYGYSTSGAVALAGVAQAGQQFADSQYQADIDPADQGIGFLGVLKGAFIATPPPLIVVETEALVNVDVAISATATQSNLPSVSTTGSVNVNVRLLEARPTTGRVAVNVALAHGTVDSTTGQVTPPPTDGSALQIDYSNLDVAPAAMPGASVTATATSSPFPTTELGLVTRTYFPLDSGISVRILTPAPDLQLIDIVPSALSVSVLDEVKGDGAGSFKILADDPVFAATPELANYLNVAQISVDGVVRGAFVIKNVHRELVGDGENAQVAYEFSGPGLREWLKHAVVYPQNQNHLPITSLQPGTRYFNFSSPIGAWYNPAEWPAPQGICQVRADMGYTAGATHGNPWGTSPVGWPDVQGRAVYWTWDRNSLPSAPQGDVYFRRTFSTTDTKATYTLFVTADNGFQAYIDGVPISAQNKKDAWHFLWEGSIDLGPGVHTLAIKATNDGGPAGMACLLYKNGRTADPADEDGLTNTNVEAQLLAWSGDGYWHCKGYPTRAPGFTAGEVLTTLINEAKVRGVSSLQALKVGFSQTSDSNGEPWLEPLDWTFDIGSTYYEVMTRLEELACEIRIDPVTFTLHAYNKQGTDRSAQTTTTQPVIFQRGHNVLTAAEDSEANFITAFLVSYGEDKVAEIDGDASTGTPNIPGVLAPSAPSPWGRIEGYAATDTSYDLNTATTVANKMLELGSKPLDSATITVTDVADHTPWKDFKVGDWVLGPGTSGMQKRRVMSIAASADSKTGSPRYELELDSKSQDMADKINQFLQRIPAFAALGTSVAAGSSGITSPPNPSDIGTPTSPGPNDGVPGTGDGPGGVGPLPDPGTIPDPNNPGGTIPAPPSGPSVDPLNGQVAVVKKPPVDTAPKPTPKTPTPNTGDTGGSTTPPPTGTGTGGTGGTGGTPGVGTGVPTGVVMYFQPSEPTTAGLGSFWYDTDGENY